MDYSTGSKIKTTAFLFPGIYLTYADCPEKLLGERASCIKHITIHTRAITQQLFGGIPAGLLGSSLP